VTAVTGPVAFVLKGYPRLSETFIAQEIRALEERGLDIRIVSLRHPTDPATHPVHREIRAPVMPKRRKQLRGSTRISCTRPVPWRAMPR